MSVQSRWLTLVADNVNSVLREGHGLIAPEWNDLDVGKSTARRIPPITLYQVIMHSLTFLLTLFPSPLVSPLQLVKVSPSMLKAARLLLLDRIRMSDANLEHADQKKAMDMLCAPRTAKLPASWEREVILKRKKQKMGAKGDKTGNIFAALHVDTSSSEDEEC